MTDPTYSRDESKMITTEDTFQHNVYINLDQDKGIPGGIAVNQLGHPRGWRLLLFGIKIDLCVFVEGHQKMYNRANMFHTVMCGGVLSTWDINSLFSNNRIV